MEYRVDLRLHGERDTYSDPHAQPLVAAVALVPALAAASVLMWAQRGQQGGGQ